MTTHTHSYNSGEYIRVDGTNFSIAQISASGQCFRMTEQEGGWFQVIANGQRLRLKQEQPSTSNKCQKNSVILMDCSEADFRTIWKSYFDLNTDYRRFLTGIDP